MLTKSRLVAAKQSVGAKHYNEAANFKQITAVVSAKIADRRLRRAAV